MEIISLLKNTKSFLDLDINTQQEELNLIKAINTIVSYHNYKETPTKKELLEIIEKMKNFNPAIYKIATMCNNEKDSLTLLNVILELKEKGVKYIVLGMSENGIITRIFGTLWGNEMIFAPVNRNESSASGQLTRIELEEIFKVLN